MVIALRTDLLIFLEREIVNRFAAGRTFLPQALGHDALFLRADGAFLKNRHG
jgi:hypothetical protein